MADILIVDDDPDAAAALADVMEFEGHATRVAYDGEHGLRSARERTPDLVLVDIEMPILDGPGMARRMLLYDRGLEQVPVALVSGAPEIRSFAARVGTPYFLPKPYTFDQLVEVVGRALAERTPPRGRWSPP
jgi:DNA-binding NtrC family response regulator